MTAAITTIKVPVEVRDRIAALASKRHVSQAEVVLEALLALERQEFWASVSDGYSRLREDTDEWSDYVAERDEWVTAPLADEAR